MLEGRTRSQGWQRGVLKVAQVGNAGEVQVQARSLAGECAGMHTLLQVAGGDAQFAHSSCLHMQG